MSAVEKSFKKKYPISVGGALFVPLVFRGAFGDDKAIPYPKLAGMRSFAAYTGIGYGTLRTMLAKWKKESLIETVGEEEPGRYRLGSLMETVRLTRRERPADIRFTILVFSFASRDAKQRYRMQQLLKHFGFRRFAQNAYANINFDDSGLRRILEDEGLMDNAFLFSQAADEDAGLAMKLIALWSPEKIAESLKRFARDLKEYFDDAPLDDEALFCRFFYAGTAYYEHFTLRVPNIPEDRISDLALLTKIEKLLGDFQVRYRDRMVGYYTRINA